MVRRTPRRGWHRDGNWHRNGNWHRGGHWGWGARGDRVGLRLGGALVAAGLLLSGCGGSESPADKVPELAATLAEVDDAIVDGDYPDAESAVEELVGEARSAAQDGQLTQGEVDEIEATATALLDALRTVEEGEEETPTPTPTEEPTTPEPSETESESPTEEPTETPTETPEESPSETDDGGNDGGDDGNGIDLGNGNGNGAGGG